jgi:hypothetical protein
MVTREWQLTVGVDWRDDSHSGALLLLFGRHLNLIGGTNGGKISGKLKSGSRQKCEVCNTPGVTQGPGSIHALMTCYHMCLSGGEGAPKL